MLGKKKLTFLSGVTLLAILAGGFLLWEGVSRIGASRKLWSEIKYGKISASERGEILQLQQDLKDAEKLTVEFRDTPLIRCLEIVNHQIKTEYGMEPIRFEFSDNLDPQRPITLRLTDVPASELLRYIDGVGECGMLYQPDRSMRLVSKKSQEWVGEGWFDMRELGPVFSHLSSSKTPVDVRRELEEFGIQFRPGEVATYHPKREMLFVRANRDCMDMVPSLGAYGCWFSFTKPTWKQRITDWWWTIRYRRSIAKPSGGTPPLPAHTSSVAPPAANPFAAP